MKRTGFLQNILKRNKPKTGKDKNNIEKQIKEKKEVAVIQPKEIPIVTAEKIVAYMDAFNLASQLEPNEKNQFLAVAIEFGLYPF